MAELEYTNRDQRPPFEPGNTLSLTHGAHSLRVLTPIAAAYVEQALVQLPLLADPSYGPAVERWAMAEARVSRYEEWLAEREDFDDPEPTEWCRRELRLWSKRASEMADALGLTPKSRAAIGSALASIRKANRFGRPDTIDEGEAR